MSFCFFPRSHSGKLRRRRKGLEYLPRQCMHAIAKVECANNCFAFDSWPFPGLHSILSQDLKSRCFALGVSHQIFATPLFAVRYLENDRYQLSRVSVRLKAFTAAFTNKRSTNSTVHYRHSRCLLFAHGCSWAATITHHSYRFVGSWFIYLQYAWNEWQAPATFGCTKGTRNAKGKNEKDTRNLAAGKIKVNFKKGERPSHEENVGMPLLICSQFGVYREIMPFSPSSFQAPKYEYVHERSRTSKVRIWK